jgi:hypothetical protein
VPQQFIDIAQHLFKATLSDLLVLLSVLWHFSWYYLTCSQCYPNVLVICQHFLKISQHFEVSFFALWLCLTFPKWMSSKYSYLLPWNHLSMIIG